MHTFPWWDRPRGVNTRPDTAYTLSTSLTSARPCRLADLELSASAGAAAGSVIAGVDFHNVSGSACALRGTPRIQVLDRAGTVWQSNAADAAGKAATVVLVPNSWAASGGWAIGASCGSEPVTTRLRVGLPAGDRTRDVPLVVGTPGPSNCDLGTRRPHPYQLGVTPIEAMDQPSGTGRFGLMDSLASTLRVPATVRRGTVLHYQLLLTADTQSGSGVGNEICPLYEQGLGNGTATSYELRCDDTVNLVEGQAVAYDLQLAVPATAATGPTRVSLRFLEPDLPAITAPVTVVR